MSTTTCYACDGRQVIPVETWDGDEVITLQATCVRCHGRGEITDGLTLSTLLREIRPTWQAGTECWCCFPVDGAAGHPYCPAR